MANSSSLKGAFPNEKGEEKVKVPNEYKEAVTLACQMIREYHQQNSCIEEVAGKYNLDPTELTKYVKAIQSKGRKNKIVGRKYRYYIICRIAEDVKTHRKICYERPKIIKTLSKEQLTEKYKAEDDYKTNRNSYGTYITEYYTDFLGNSDGYENKSDCEEAFADLKSLLADKEYIYNY